MSSSNKATTAAARVAVRKLATELGWTAGELRTILQPKRANKGADWEREFAVMLSRWWCRGATDAFWRTAGSGGRAAGRHAAGRTTTAGQHGDIGPTDDRGAPLCRVLTWELKRGYEESTLHQIIDADTGAGCGQLADHIRQAAAASDAAGSVAWALVTRRQRRAALVWLPATFWHQAQGVGAWTGPRVPSTLCRWRRPEISPAAVYVMQLDDFFEGITPAQIREIDAQKNGPE